MSSISGIGSASSAWAMSSTSRSDRLFAKVDSDGSGSVDATELQTMLDKVSKATGSDDADAATVMKSADANGDGSLSKAELGDALKSLLPAASSTVEFAHRMQAGDGGDAKSDGLFAKLDTDGDGQISKAEFEAGKAKMEGGHHLHGGPPPDAAAATGGAGSATTSTDPLDTNGDGTVSASERAAGDLKNLLADLAQASQDTSATSGASSSGRSGQGSGDSSKTQVDFAALTQMLLQQYQQSASTTAENSTSLSLTA